MSAIWLVCFFFFNDTATTEIYTLSLHDALPISGPHAVMQLRGYGFASRLLRGGDLGIAEAYLRGEWDTPDLTQFLYLDRKSTRLNSSHLVISYAVFCLKKNNMIAYPATDCLYHH